MKQIETNGTQSVDPIVPSHEMIRVDWDSRVLSTEIITGYATGMGIFRAGPLFTSPSRLALLLAKLPPIPTALLSP